MTYPRLRRLLAAVTVGAAVVALAPAPGWAAARDRTPPTVPTDVRVTGVTETSVSLAWRPSTDNSGSVRYQVEILGTTWSFGGITGSTATVGQTLLNPATAYTFRVSAYDAALNFSAPSGAAGATTLADGRAPSAPANLRVTQATPHTVALGWDRSVDNVTNWPGLLYRVYDGSTLLGVVTNYGNPPAQVPFVRRHLPAGKVLDLTVRAVDSSGNVSAPSALTVDLPESADVTPPSAPRLLSAADALYGQGKLTWVPSTDDGTAAADIEYEFLVDGVPVLANGASFAHPLVRGATVGWVSVPRPPGVFSFQVVAVDAAGNMSPPSNALRTEVTIGY